MDLSDATIVAIVMGLRIFVPLLIPRFPLPAILAAFFLDTFDHPIFLTFTSVNMDNYQGYDKALDTYYLAIAYISTLRNWSNWFGFRLSKGLYFYRLVGVALFEFLQIRALLVVFTNIFEYLFMFYEAVSIRWKQERLTKRSLVTATVLITVFIKIPQEYIIHIAQTDITAWFNEHVFKVEPLNTPIAESMKMRPDVVIMIGVLLLVIIGGLWWWITRKLPAADGRKRFEAEAMPVNVGDMSVRDYEKILSWSVFEKIVLVGLLSLIFAQVLPGVVVTYPQLIGGVLVLILTNVGISHYLITKAKQWRSMKREFAVLMTTNLLLVAGYTQLLPHYQGSDNLFNGVFIVYLLTLIVVMYDRYRVVHLMRFSNT